MPLTLYPFMDVGLEDAMVAELEVRRLQARATVASLSKAQGQRLAKLSFQYPSLGGGVLAAAAMAGLEPGDPSLDEIQRRSVLADVREQATFQASASTPRGWGWDLFATSLLAEGKEAVRLATTALDALYKEVVVGGTSFAVGLAGGMSPGEAAERSFGYSPGALALASAMQGRPVNLGEGLTFDQSKLAPEVQQIFDAVGGMGGLRNLTPDQARQFKLALNSPAQLELGIPAWLASEVHRQAEGVRIGAEGPDQPGRPVTPGRLQANWWRQAGHMIGVDVLEPGSGAYDFVSGVGDFASNIVADPSTPFLKLGGAMRTANRALVPNAVRPTVFQRHADEWLGSPHGRAVSEMVAETTDYNQIYGLLSHSSGRRRPNARLAAALTETRSPSEAARIMREAVQVGQLERVVAPQSLAGRAVGAVTGAPVGTLTGAALGPLTGNARAARLGATTIPEQLGEVVMGTAGQLAGVGVSRRMGDTPLARWAMTLHRGDIDPHDVDAGVENLSRFMRLAQFEPEQTSAYMHRLATIPEGGYDEAYHVVSDVMEQWGDRLSAAGVTPQKVRPLTNLFSEWEEFRKYFQNLAGDPEYVPGGRIEYHRYGEVEVMPGAQLFSEMLERTIPLPEPQKVREAMRRVRLAEWRNPRVAAALLDTPPAQLARAVGEGASWLMSNAWKPLVLFRIAYPVRVISEEQFRMGGAGLDSFINHPMSAWAWVTGHKGALPEDMTAAWTAHRQAMSRGQEGSMMIGSQGPRRRINTGEYLTFRKGVHAEHLSSWTGELSQLWSDELASAIARAVYPGVDEAAIGPPGAFGQLPPGQRGLPETGTLGGDSAIPSLGPVENPPAPNFVFTSPGILDGVKERFWDGDLSHLRRRLVEDESKPFDIRTNANAYIESIWARINSKTGGRYVTYAPARGGWFDDIGNRFDDATPPGGNDTYAITQPGDPRLIEAIASGRLDDFDLVDADPGTYERIQRHLGDNYIDVAPDKIKGPRSVDANLMDGWNRALQSVFRVLMGARTDKLSRSPAFRQIFWRDYGRLYPLADEPTRALMIKQARAANIPRRDIAAWRASVAEEGTRQRTPTPLSRGQTRRVTAPASDPVFDSIEQIETLASAVALQEVQRLLYDLSRRRNFFEMTRLIFPFGEAWNEILTTWSRLLVENPSILRRASQGITGARSSGFFYPDPSTGDEVFNYPGSEFLAEHMFAPEDGEANQSTPQLTGRVAGLNLAFGSVMPGVGPMVQFPAATMDWLTTDPDYKWLREIVFPFGAPDTETPGEVLDAMMPAWMRRGMQALAGGGTGDHQRLFNNTVIDVQRAMQLAGQWDASSQAAYNASMTTAKERAKQLFLIRMLSSFAAPTGASIRWDAETDPNGRLVAYQVLANEYHKLYEQTGGDAVLTFDTFVQRFGIDPLALVEPKSQAIVPRTDSEVGYDWQAEHDQQFQDFPLTAYFARPDGADADFYYPAYLAQFRDQLGLGGPARRPLTPEQWDVQYNMAAGGMIYRRGREAVAEDNAQSGRATPTDAQRAWLRVLHDQLKEEYPGFGGEPTGVSQAATRDDMIDELYDWHLDPVMAESETGQGLAVYLEARDKVIAEAATRDVVGWSTAQSTEDLRLWLQAVAQSIIMEHPDFLSLYDRVLSSEIEEAAPPTPTQLAGIDLTP